MPFIAEFTVGQSNDGTILTFTDISNYGATPTTNKSNFTGRSLTLTFALSPTVPVVINWPYTNTNNTLQDQITYTISKDVSFVARLDLTNPSVVPSGSDVLFLEAPMCTTEFTEMYKRKLLADTNSCRCNKNRLASDICIIEVGIISALNRAARGDIYGAQKDISFSQDKAKLLAQ